MALVFPFRGAIPRPREVAPWINFVDLETLSDDAIVEKVDLGDPKVTNFLIAKDERAAKNVDTRVQALLDKASDASFYSELYDWTLGDKDKDLGDEEGDEEGDDAGDKKEMKGSTAKKEMISLRKTTRNCRKFPIWATISTRIHRSTRPNPRPNSRPNFEAEPRPNPATSSTTRGKVGKAKRVQKRAATRTTTRTTLGREEARQATPKKTSQTLRAPRPQEPRPRQAVHDPARRRRRVQARPCRPTARRRRRPQGRSSRPAARRHRRARGRSSHPAARRRRHPQGRSSHPAARRRRRAHRGPHLPWRRAFRRGHRRAHPRGAVPLLQIFRCRRTRTSPGRFGGGGDGQILTTPGRKATTSKATARVGGSTCATASCASTGSRRRRRFRSCAGTCTCSCGPSSACARPC